MRALLNKFTRVLLISAVLILLPFNAQILRSAEENPALKFLVSGKQVKEMTLGELESTLETHSIELYDPEYRKTKRYSGFSVQDVLTLGFGEELNNPDFTDIAFTALDGYESVSVLSKMKEKGGYIVFADLDYPDWEPVGRAQASPGPFYLVWAEKDELPDNGYPWPWQIASVNIMRFPDQYPLVFPAGAGKDSAAYKGYEIFKGRCVKCHSMNRQGGKVGPDLNAPESIVSYRSEYMIKEFIKHPSKYRYTQMPDHPDLTDQDLNDLIAYFRYMDSIRK